MLYHDINVQPALLLQDLSVTNCTMGRLILEACYMSQTVPLIVSLCKAVAFELRLCSEVMKL